LENFVFMLVNIICANRKKCHDAPQK
jgi:hypothetical protein